MSHMMNLLAIYYLVLNKIVGCETAYVYAFGN